MLITLPITELVPGMYVDSVTKQHEGVNGIKIKTSGLVREKSIIKRLATEGVLELLIDFTKGDVAIPAKYKPTSKSPVKNKNLASTKLSDQTKAKPAKDKSKLVNTPASITLEQEFAAASEGYERHSKKLKSLYGDITAGMAVNVKVLDEIAGEIVSSVFRNTNAMTILTRVKDKHNYNWRHMINCAIFTAVFAKYLGYKQGVVQQLAMGALLHDLGQAKIPQGILSKPSKLTDIEMSAVKKHVSQGLILAKEEEGVTPLMLDMIVNHHERLDGSGYPRGVSDQKLSRAARIMAIVDVYDAMTADKLYKEGDEPINALRYLLASNKLFDAELVQRFIKCLGVHPVGSIVKLTNERLAIVLEGNTQNPIKPKVKLFYNAKHNHHVTPKDIDLSTDNQELKILASVKPMDYQINLSRLLKDHLLV
ncbi:putative metal-dependent phosphohydrolase, HD region [Alteromonadales bacterium TW-7]|jgi:HD-GYP domain-containing protein (c-di-GMP phosphodiesterase class II)|nr:putative metal-dependent phosphohydrolase, HD region [Alteromonadales bacterium TW-7]